MWRKQKQCQYKSGRGCTTGFVLRVGREEIYLRAGSYGQMSIAFRSISNRKDENSRYHRAIVPPYLVENIEEQN